MRLAIVSDMHGNMRAFEAVLADLEEARPDRVVHGGDLALNGARPAEVIDRVRELGWEGVMGNTEEALWQLPAAMPGFIRKAIERRAAATREMIGAERLDWLRTLPRDWHGEGIGLVHAVPGNLWTNIEATAPDDKLRQTYAALREPLAVYCHIHKPYVRDLGGLVVANSGSAGQPFDGDTRPSYLVIEAGRPSIRRVSYDVEAACAELRGSGYPDAGDIAASISEARVRPPGVPGWARFLLRASGRI